MKKTLATAAALVVTWAGAVGSAAAQIDAGAEPADAGVLAPVLDAGIDAGLVTETQPDPMPPVVVPTPTPPAAPPVAPMVEDASIPLNWELHGYYRARFVWSQDIPVYGVDPLTASPVPGDADVGYAFQRMRLEPNLLYGSNPAAPIAALRLQIDMLDNVVFGDNARLARTPLFAADPSYTDIEGFDAGNSIELKRAWLEFLMPIGQIRVGRMPSQWGLGILTGDGNGITGDWGDPQFGTTYDRFLFATRPLTIANTISSGDSRPTPLIFVVAYDKLVDDPLYGPTDDPTDRSRIPFAFLANGGDDVQEAILALAYSDPQINPMRATDTLAAGLYYVHRWQTETESYVHIIDGFWRVRYALGPRMPSLYVAGEIVTIQGRSNAISLAGPSNCPRREPGETELTLCNDINANIWGGTFHAGLIDEGWAFDLEGGWSSGDDVLFDSPAPGDSAELTMRPLHPDYRVGLVMYPIAVAAATANGLGEDLRPLWSRGGVWNSIYLFPQGRVSLTTLGLPLDGFELVGGFLLAWADELLGSVYDNERPDSLMGGEGTACGMFEGDCFLGWEIDLALKAVWGENDLLRWSTEFGIMHAGEAFLGNDEIPKLTEEWLWTLQMRMAIVF